MVALNWTDAEVFQLLSCCAEEGVQEQLEGCKRKKHVYENLSKHKLTGHGRIEWKFFKKLDEILGNRPATRPPFR